MLAIGCTASRVPAQTAPVADPAANNDAMAAINPQDLVSVGDGKSAPAVVPLKKTNYPVPAGAIFVSPDGKTNATGTQNAPTSLQNALKIAPAGATIVFRGGTYRGLDSLLAPRRVTFQAARGEAPWIKGSVIVTGWVRDGSAWRKDNWTHKFGASPRIGPEYVDPKFPLAGERDMVFLNDQALQQVATRAEVGPGSFFVDGKAQKLFIGDDPSGKVVEAAVYEQGLQIWKNGPNDPTGSIVRGLGFAHYGDQGLTVRAPNVLIEDNTFAWSGQRGMNIYDAPHAVIRGNAFVANSRVGLRASRNRRLVVENNLFAWNNVDRWRPAWDAAGVKITNMDYGAQDGLLFRGNLAENNAATGVWLDIDVNDAVVVHNIARRNQGIGIFFEISDKAIIAFNLSYENGMGVMVSNARNARVWNNTLVNNGSNILVKESGRISKIEGNIAGTNKGEMFATTGNQFFNNILAGVRGQSKNPLFNAGDSIGPTSDMVVASDFNLYVRPDSSPVPFASWSNSKQEIAPWQEGAPKPVMYQTLADFSQATGLEKNGVFRAGAQSEISPFVGWEKENFRPRSASAVAGAAPLPEDVAKAAGVPRNIGFKGALAPVISQVRTGSAAQ